MPGRRPLLLPLLCLLFVFPLHAQAPSGDEAIAQKFFPLALDQDFRENHAPGITPTRIATAVRADLDGSGTDDYLAVAYSNGFAGMLRIIRGTTIADAVLVTESADPTMGGRGHPLVDLIDIDNDGRPEIAVQFARASYIFKYKSEALSVFGPTREVPSGRTSSLGYVAFVDVDGDGVMEIFELTMGPGNASPYNVYKLASDGTFVKTAMTTAFTDRFYRADGEPVVEARTFNAVPGNYTVQIVNGDQGKNYAVSSAQIILNGVSVAVPKDFNKIPRTITVPVKLLGRNTITVELRSDPGSELSVTIANGQ